MLELMMRASAVEFELLGGLLEKALEIFKVDSVFAFASNGFHPVLPHIQDHLVHGTIVTTEHFIQVVDVNESFDINRIVWKLRK